MLCATVVEVTRVVGAGFVVVVRSGAVRFVTRFAFVVGVRFVVTASDGWAQAARATATLSAMAGPRRDGTIFSMTASEEFE